MSVIRPLILISIMFGLSLPALAVPVIVEDFEGDLSAWTGKSDLGGAHNGLIVVDPFDSSNHVLTFSALQGAGDIFTVDTATSANGTYTVSFDYLGLPKPGTVAGDHGGYFGASRDLPGHHYWVAGTGSYPTPIDLIDDGQWHHYDLTFTPNLGTNDVHFMLEDWDGSGGVAGDIYFDNLVFGDQIAVQNLPASDGLIFILLGAAGLVIRKFKVSIKQT